MVVVSAIICEGLKEKTNILVVIPVTGTEYGVLKLASTEITTTKLYAI